jgi:hypothetical protein
MFFLLSVYTTCCTCEGGASFLVTDTLPLSIDTSIRYWKGLLIQSDKARRHRKVGSFEVGRDKNSISRMLFLHDGVKFSAESNVNILQTRERVQRQNEQENYYYYSSTSAVSLPGMNFYINISYGSFSLIRHSFCFKFSQLGRLQHHLHRTIGIRVHTIFEIFLRNWIFARVMGLVLCRPLISGAQRTPFDAIP